MNEQEKQIKRLCKMSQLSFSDEKLEEWQGYLSPLKELIKKINTSSVDQSTESHCFDVMRYEKTSSSPFTVMRKDVEKPGLNKEDLEKIAPNFKNNYFIIPRAISEESF